MIEELKSIYSLVKLNNIIFKNTLVKTDNRFKIIALVLIVFLLLNSIQSSPLLVQYAKDWFNKDSVLFRPLFNIILFIVFIANILTTFYLNSSNCSHNLFKTLLHYPIKFSSIIFYIIISGIGDFINLLFFPLYVAAILILNTAFGWISLLILLVILFLFLFSISNIIYLVNNIFVLISSTKHSKKIILLSSLLFILISIVIIETLPHYLQNFNNIISTGKYLEIFPTGVFISFILNTRSDIVIANIFSTLVYFITLNVLLFTLNYQIAKYFRNRSYGKSIITIDLKRSLLTKYLLIIPVNPFSKKDLAYTLRSLRTMPVHLIIAIVIPILIYAFGYTIQDKALNYYDLKNLLSFSFLFISLLVVSFAGNIYAFDGKAVINYFFRPISGSSSIKSKTLIANIYVAAIIFINLILFLISRTEISYIIFCELILYMSYLLLMFFALYLSIFFPKDVLFNSMNGFLTPLVTLFIFMITAIIILFVLQSTFAIYVHSDSKLLMSFLLGLIISSFLNFKKKIYIILGNLLSKRKENIINVFR